MCDIIICGGGGVCVRKSEPKKIYMRREMREKKILHQSCTQHAARLDVCVRFKFKMLVAYLRFLCKCLQMSLSVSTTFKRYFKRFRGRQMLFCVFYCRAAIKHTHHAYLSGSLCAPRELRVSSAALSPASNHMRGGR